MARLIHMIAMVAMIFYGPEAGTAIELLLRRTLRRLKRCAAKYIQSSFRRGSPGGWCTGYSAEIK